MASRPATTVFRADPLAGRLHKGGQMSRDVFLTFAGSNGFDALGLREASAPRQGGPNMAQTTVTLEPIQPPVGVHYKAGIARFEATGRLTPTVKDGEALVDAVATIEQSDDRVPHGHRFLRLSSGGSAGRFLLERDTTPVDGAIPPATGSDCDAEVAPLKAEIERLQAQIDALQGPDDQP